MEAQQRSSSWLMMIFCKKSSTIWYSLTQLHLDSQRYSGSFMCECVCMRVFDCRDTPVWSFSWLPLSVFPIWCGMKRRVRIEGIFKVTIKLLKRKWKLYLCNFAQVLTSDGLHQCKLNKNYLKKTSWTKTLWKNIGIQSNW